ncbi:MAG: TIGR02147 family protein [Bdellovibrionales bacterium]|nr:TIGR02147 family protein [Bdellovibrionales bacterium]
MDSQLLIQSRLREQLYLFQQKNPAYSLRAFAKKLNLSPSALSEILNGKRKISQKKAMMIFERLGANPIEVHELQNAFGEKASKTKSKKSELEHLEANSTGNLKFLELSADQFNIIEKWHHFAILSLMETKDFKASVPWIAKRINITETEVKLALDRLARLGLIKCNEKKTKISLTGGSLITSDDIANQAVKRSHYEDLKFAEVVLDNVNVIDRDFTSVTVAVDSKKIAKAKKMIREFQDRLSEFLESGEKDEVYKMTFYLYPLTNIDENKKNKKNSGDSL